MRRLLTCLLLTLPLSSPALAAGAVNTAVGDVGPTRAVLWARAPAARELNLWLREGRQLPSLQRVAVDADSDHAGRFVLEDLRPDTLYDYRVWAGDGPLQRGWHLGERGRFRTAPRPQDAAPVRLAFGADLGGGNVCRERGAGFPTLRAVHDYDPGLFLALGDMIYADSPCQQTGRFGASQLAAPAPARTLADYRARWRYTLADGNLSALRSTRPYIAVWDDHEIANDAGPAEPESTALLAPARQAFLDYNPVPPSEPAGTLYRQLRWGRHLALFLLDTRQYRDAARWPDDPARPKSLLGRAQRQWLETALTGSDATWKVIVSSVPLSIPTGAPGRRDGWADGGDGTGYELELLALLRQLAAADVNNVVFLAGDAHLPALLVHRPLADVPTFEVIEAIAGPLAAGFGEPPTPDSTLNPQLLFERAPAAPPASRQAAEGWLNFGTLEIAADGALTLGFRNARNEPLFERRLSP